MSDAPVYGFYLRPAPRASRAVSEMHALLRAQFGLRTGGLFMPHMTIRGFFRSGAPVEEVRAVLDEPMRDWQAVPVFAPGPIAFSRSGIALDARNLGDGSRNEALHDLQDRAWAALDRVVAPGCEFTPRDWRGRDGATPFRPHITLAMSDIPEWGFDEVFAFVREAWPLGETSFVADTCQLFRFQASWDSAWWRDLTWEWLGSWYADRADPAESEDTAS
ncbi:MAG: 2'-5' RNA ligase family protein [Tepidiformaceae bacterium]